MTANPSLSTPKVLPAVGLSQEAMMTTCDVVSMGDGTFHVVPRRPQSRVTIREAARLARYSRDTIYRLFHSRFVTGERLSPRKILINVDSLQAHLDAVRAPDFWTRERRRQYWGA